MRKNVLKNKKDQFDSDHIDWLKDKLSVIQNNPNAWIEYNSATPFKVTQAELDFICEEDKKTERYFMDYLLKEWNPRSKTYSPRWIRDPYMTDAQVKKQLSYFFSKNYKHKISNLRITSEDMLEKKVTAKRIDTNEEVEVSLRENYFGGAYEPWTNRKDFPQACIIEFAHKVSFKIVDEKDSEYFAHTSSNNNQKKAS